MTVSTIILAGSRPENCPVCDYAGVSAKALTPVAGERMIDHVLRAVRDTRVLGDGDIWLSGLSIEAFLDGAPSDLLALKPRLRQAPANTDGPAAATLAALDAGDAEPPLLITTADHPLLTPQMIETFVDGAEREHCDVAIGLATRTVIAAAYPHVRRTYLNFAGEGYSGCNLFMMRTAEGRKAAEFWRDIGRDRKKPWKLAHRIGFGTLARMMLGRLGLAGAFRHASMRIGVKACPVLIPIAEAAIDVDKPCDLDLVGTIMEACRDERVRRYG